MQKSLFLSGLLIVTLIVLITGCEKDEQEIPTLEEKISEQRIDQSYERVMLLKSNI
jgi:hypothetical protein